MSTDNPQANGFGSDLPRFLEWAGVLALRATRSVLGKTEDAEDTSQNALVKMYVTIQDKGWPENDCPRAWVLRIAHNEAVNLILARNRKRKSDPLDRASPLVDPDGGNVDIIDPDADRIKKQDQIDEEYERLEEAKRMFFQLSEGERECLILQWDGMSIQQIADHRGVSVNTIKTLLRLGKRKLRGDDPECGSLDV